MRYFTLCAGCLILGTMLGCRAARGALMEEAECATAPTAAATTPRTTIATDCRAVNDDLPLFGRNWL